MTNAYGENLHEEIYIMYLTRILDDDETEYKKRYKKSPGMASGFCQFEGLPYIKQFLRFLYEYRLENKLSQITIEQMDEALALYMIREKGKKEHQYERTPAIETKPLVKRK